MDAALHVEAEDVRSVAQEKEAVVETGKRWLGRRRRVERGVVGTRPDRNRECGDDERREEGPFHAWRMFGAPMSVNQDLCLLYRTYTQIVRMPA